MLNASLPLRLTDGCIAAIASARGEQMRTLAVSGNSQLGPAAWAALARYGLALTGYSFISRLLGTRLYHVFILSHSGVKGSPWPGTHPVRRSDSTSSFLQSNRRNS